MIGMELQNESLEVHMNWSCTREENIRIMNSGRVRNFICGVRHKKE